jgi:hypothetical protein
MTVPALTVKPARNGPPEGTRRGQCSGSYAWTAPGPALLHSPFGMIEAGLRNEIPCRRWSSTLQAALAAFRVSPDVIVVAVRLYLRYGLSYRDVEELLLERGVEVDHVTIFGCVERFTPLHADARLCRRSPGDR